MKTVIVSDRLRLDSPLWDVDIVPWSSRPAIEGYPAVVLDLYFGEAAEEGFYPLDKVPCNFYELGTEVVRCLPALIPNPPKDTDGRGEGSGGGG